MCNLGLTCVGNYFPLTRPVPRPVPNSCPHFLLTQSMHWWVLGAMCLKHTYRVLKRRNPQTFSGIENRSLSSHRSFTEHNINASSKEPFPPQFIYCLIQCNNISPIKSVFLYPNLKRSRCQNCDTVNCRSLKCASLLHEPDIQRKLLLKQHFRCQDLSTVPRCQKLPIDSSSAFYGVLPKLTRKKEKAI